MKKIRTIFEMLGKECEEESCIDFDEWCDYEGCWTSILTCTEDDSNDFDTVIHIMDDEKFKYYVAVDDRDTELGCVYLFRTKVGDC